MALSSTAGPLSAGEKETPNRRGIGCAMPTNPAVLNAWWTGT
ncbi:hypothetical protein ABZZ74_46390 [Streptomyces sp. NPDC006476]